MSREFQDDDFSSSGEQDEGSDATSLNQHATKSTSTKHTDLGEREYSLPQLPQQSTRSRSRDRRPHNLVLETNTQAGVGLPQVDEAEQAEAAKEKFISWRSLPRKDQLLVLTLARLSEPLTQTSLGSYIFYQIKSFNPSLPDSIISSQVGIIHASFPAAQFLTAILWGRFADSEHGGRKRVIWIGLLGTMFSILGFGFSQSFKTAVFFRCLGGVLNGNIGVMRTMISEIVKEKKFQSRAFLILPGA